MGHTYTLICDRAYLQVSDGHCIGVDVPHFKFALLDGPMWNHNHFLWLGRSSHLLLRSHGSILDYLMFGVFRRCDKCRNRLILHDRLHHDGSTLVVVVLLLPQHHLLLLPWTCRRHHNLLHNLAPLCPRLKSTPPYPTTTLPQHHLLLLLPVHKKLLLALSRDGLPISRTNWRPILLLIYDQLLMLL